MSYSPTQLQLTHVLQQLLRRLGGKVTTATGGSTTTFIDTKLESELEGGNEDDIFNGGTVIVIEDAGGAFGAPEGELSRITDYVASTQTGTFSPALTTAIASGDKILISPPDFPLFDMIEVVNDALKDLTELPRFDTSITTTSNQTEYTLPLAVKGGRIINVEIQGITTDSNDNRWQPIPNWREAFANAGSTGTFRLLQYPQGYTVRITYMKHHPRVKAFDDYIDEHLHPHLVHSAVFAFAMQWRNDNDNIIGGADQAKVSLEQKAWTQYDRAKIEHRVEVPPKNFSQAPAWDSWMYDTDKFKDIPLP